jgi:PAS domain S-box-containing protein
MKPGDHSCFIYDNDEEHRKIITPFLRNGLEQNEKVVYIVDARDPKAIFNYLKTDGVDVEHYQKKGQFSILTSTDTYLKGGVFDPDWMMSILSSETQKALDEGYTALRMTCEMSWALRDLPGSRRLIEYENNLNTFFPGCRCLTICQYDRQQFDAGILLNILLTHPFVFIGANIYHNFYYTSPNDIQKPNRSDITLNGWIKNILDRRVTEDVLRESEERYRRLTDNSPDVIYRMSLPDGKYEYVSPAAIAIFGYSPQEFYDNPQIVRKIIHPDWIPYYESQWQRLVKGDVPPIYEYQIVHKNGDVRWINQRNVMIRDEQGNLVALEGIVADITERKRSEMLLKRYNEELDSEVHSRTIDLERVNTMLGVEVIQRTLAEESIRKSLNERELLLREIYHRVRNNLQIIVSLISLQSRNIKDPYLLETLGDFKNRIKAMAHVHDWLCRADDISRIDLSEIVTFLGTSLFKSYKIDPQLIRLNVDMKDIHITIDSAISISLILNELITNSIKHAFPNGTAGEITIAGRREADTLVLSIRDTGIGMPKDLDWMGSQQTLGLRLVVSLVEQLNGTIELDRAEGTKFTIVVKEKD